VYYSDLAPVLWAFDAVAETQGNAGVERFSVREFLNQRAHGPQDSRILTRLVVPRPSPGSWGAFLKHGKRAAVDFATASLAARFSPSGAGGSGEPALRLVLGAMGPMPEELEETETFLLGHLDRPRDVAEEAGRMARQEAAARSSLIRETAVSPTEKKAAAGIVDRGLSLLLDRLCR
jgi:carbon-monoxide dehydrogenase medium subunit